MTKITSRPKAGVLTASVPEIDEHIKTLDEAAILLCNGEWQGDNYVLPRRVAANTLIRINEVLEALKDLTK